MNEKGKASAELKLWPAVTAWKGNSMDYDHVSVIVLCLN